MLVVRKATARIGRRLYLDASPCERPTAIQTPQFDFPSAAETKGLFYGAPRSREVHGRSSVRQLERQVPSVGTSPNYGRPLRGPQAASDVLRVRRSTRGSGAVGPFPRQADCPVKPSWSRAVPGERLALLFPRQVNSSANELLPQHRRIPASKCCLKILAKTALNLNLSPMPAEFRYDIFISPSGMDAAARPPVERSRQAGDSPIVPRVNVGSTP